VNPPRGCRFHPRCPLRTELGDPAICAETIPPLIDLGGGHLCACHFRTALDTGTVRPSRPAMAPDATRPPSTEPPDLR
jgi:hypothetical protein